MNNNLPTSYFKKNRQEICDLMHDGSLAILCAGQPPEKTADQKYDHFADRSFFYLSGVEQEKSILLLCRSKDKNRAILFISPDDLMYERWNGKRLSRQEAANLSGVDEVIYLDSLEGILADMFETFAIQRVWVDKTAKNQQALSLQKKIIELLSRQRKINILSDLSPLLIQLRMIKKPEEIELIKAAAELTGDGIKAMISQLRPGLSEYHLWSEFNHVLSQSGCLQPAFPPIVAAGENALCLHHMQPYGKINDGDLVQVDVGAVACNLCADISRVFPANGKFSEKQLKIYNIVRACQETAFSMIKPGIKITDINQACRKTAYNGLRKLHLIEEDPSKTGDYFWHSVSHHLGLDVHDICHREAVLQPGMVITVEPGVYVTQWGIGIRIEDDVLVTEDGCSLLSAAIPREAYEIEKLMAISQP